LASAYLSDTFVTNSILMKASKAISIVLLLLLFVPAGAQQPMNMENGYEYVDLRLSVKWATCNVGADKPEDYGDYFAWGETEPKSEYTWENYKFRKSGNEDWNVKFNKYGVKVDGKTVLDPEDDVAHVKWGGRWRIPSEAEFQELFNNCTTTRDSLNGIYGYRFTSNLPGYTDRSIFLPDAGYKWKGENPHEGVGEYFVNSIYVIPGHYLDQKALAVLTSPIHFTLVCDRGDGYPIRPVCPKEEITIDEFEGLEMTTQDAPLDSCHDLVPVDSLSYSAKRLKEKITIEKWSSGNVRRVSRNIYEYLPGKICVTEYQGPDAAKTEIKGKEESHIIKHWNKTDSIVEHFNCNTNGEFVRDKVITYAFDGKARLISKKTEYVDSDNPIYPQKQIMTFSYNRKGWMPKKKIEGVYVDKRKQNDFITYFSKYENNTLIGKTYIILYYNNPRNKKLLPRKELYSTWTARSNEQDQLILSEKNYQESNRLEIIKYQYDEQGNTSKEEHYYKSPRDSVERMQTINEYEYKYYP